MCCCPVFKGKCNVLHVHAMKACWGGGGGYMSIINLSIGWRQEDSSHLICFTHGDGIKHVSFMCDFFLSDIKINE
jgi:hypothetical protein